MIAPKASFKFVFICFYLVSRFLLVQAQDKNTLHERILVISYAPSMHFSDCDNLFCEKNNLSKPQWRQLLQQKIEQEVIEALSYQYTAISLYLSPNPEDQQLFKDWHKLKFCLYKESTPTRLEESKNLETNYIKFINWIKKNTAFGQEKNSLCWQENLKETKYILAYPRRHNLMDSIAQIFEVEKILLLTQVEIKTNYHTCIATDGTQFDRSIKLHYCLYNAKNEFLYGDVAVSKGQSKTTELQSFFQEHLGYLGYYILSTVEKK